MTLLTDLVTVFVGYPLVVVIGLAGLYAAYEVTRLGVYALTR